MKLSISMPNKVFTESSTKVTIINNNLVKKQGLDIPTVIKIEKLHEVRNMIEDIMVYLDESEIDKMRYYGSLITQIDFQLQKLWKFPLDPSFHRWFELPRCSCPKMDNRESIGTGYRIINPSCLLHGKK